MLGVAVHNSLGEDSSGLTVEAWAALPSQTALPWPTEEFLSGVGEPSLQGASRRQYQRAMLRKHAVITVGPDQHAVFTKDVSRKGFGLLSPLQLFPCDELEIAVADLPMVRLVVRRCRRIAERCYDCGADFAAGLASPKLFKEIMQAMR
jgi:hypothetical protein